MRHALEGDILKVELGDGGLMAPIVALSQQVVERDAHPPDRIVQREDVEIVHPQVEPVLDEIREVARKLVLLVPLGVERSPALATRALGPSEPCNNEWIGQAVPILGDKIARAVDVQDQDAKRPRVFLDQLESRNRIAAADSTR